MNTDSFIIYIKRWYLEKYCTRYWNKVWHFKLWVGKTATTGKEQVVLNFYFYIFENLINIIIFLDILLSLIGALFKYLFLSSFTSLRYLFLAFSIIATTFYNIFYNNNFTLSKCCFENIDIYIYIYYIYYIYIYIYINTSHGSLCLTNNVFILDQRETITISITSYNLAIFYFIGVFLSSIFYKKDNFNITKQIFPFLIIFSLF